MTILFWSCLYLVRPKVIVFSERQSKEIYVQADIVDNSYNGILLNINRRLKDIRRISLIRFHCHFNGEGLYYCLLDNWKEVLEDTQNVRSKAQPICYAIAEIFNEGHLFKKILA